MLPGVLEYGTAIKKCYPAYLVDLQKYPNPPNAPLYCKTWVRVSQVPPVLEYETTIKKCIKYYKGHTENIFS